MMRSNVLSPISSTRFDVISYLICDNRAHCSAFRCFIMLNKVACKNKTYIAGRSGQNLYRGT